MALNTGKILMRRGQEINFDANQMTPGEWAVSLDSRYVRMCFSPGVCVRMATYDAFEADMEQIRQILAECQTVEEAVQRIYEEIKDVAVDVERIEAAAASALESEENALNSANLAAQSAETAMQKAEEAAESANIASTKAEQATEGARIAAEKASEAAESAGNVRNISDVSQSYAVGGTGTREGEDTDNAKYYNQQASDNATRAEEAAERAAAVADVGVATTEKAGIVKPDGTTVTVDPDGTIHVKEGTKDYNDLENKPKINGVELSGELTTEDLNLNPGGGGGTSNYEELENKPQIGGVELSGDQTPDELGLVGKTDFEEFSNQTTEAVENLETGLERTTFKVDTIIEKADLGIKETASGENIHLDDSADGKVVEFGLYGKAVQDGTPTPENPVDINVSGESYNLLPYPYFHTTLSQVGVTWTDVGDGTVIANGTATATSFFTMCSIEPNIADKVFKPNTRYLLSMEIKNAKNISIYVNVNGGDIAKIANKTDGYYEVEFTTPESYNTKFTVALYRNADGTEETDCIIKPMIRKASVKNDRYMPYGKGSVEVKSIGKNLLEYPYQQTTKVVNGITFTDNKDGTITANGTATALSVFYIKTIANSSFCLEKGNYILSGNPSDGTASTYKMRLEYGSNKIIGDDIGNGVNVNITSELSNEPLQLGIMIYSGQEVSNLVFKPMIRISTDTDDTWEPYKETTSIIPTENGLAGIPVDSGGNYTDSNGQQWICDEVVKYADGSGALIQRVGKYELPKDSNYGTSTSVDGTIYFHRKLSFIPNLGSVMINSISTHFTQGNPYRESGEVLSIWAYSDSQVRFRVNGVTTINNLETWLQTNTVEILYELSTPITTPLTTEQIAEIEKLKTFYPVTNISNDFDAGMKVKYIADAKSYIDNRLALIEQAMLNSI